MDELKELLTFDPCYEQHIVSIKDIYEKHLFRILIPAIYEGFQTTYIKAYEFEQKTINAKKKQPRIVNCGILALFQKCIKDIPNLSVHRLRTETDRIKTTTKTTDIFDDLVKAVCKANIILLTYNVDHKRHELLCTKYHDSIIIHDFIHNCYINSAKNFYNKPELFYHINEPHVLNQNKHICYKIINNALKESIINILPMKDILLEYTKQPYMQKEPVKVYDTDDKVVSQTNISNGIASNKDDSDKVDSVKIHSHNVLLSDGPPPNKLQEPIKPESKMKFVNIGQPKGPIKNFFKEINPIIETKIKEYNTKPELTITRSDIQLDANNKFSDNELVNELLKI